MPKTITDIIPPSRRRAMEEAAGNPSSYAPVPSGYQPIPPSEPPRPYVHSGMESIDTPKGKFPWRLALAAAIVVVASIATMYLFSGAKVSITPRNDVATVSGEFTAIPSTGELPYEIISVEKIGIKEVKAEGTENANDPAEGTVIIYNGQEKVQELIKNTRFETPDGLLFRIHESVKVPAGTKAVPGQLQITVYADAGGEKYNIGPSTFTLPGLKGSAVYELVYAKSSGSMSGGFSGVRPSVSDKTKEAQRAEIEAGLERDLKNEIASKVAEGYVLVPGSIFISYASLPSTAGSDNNVAVQEKGMATAFVFPKDALAKAITFRSNATYAGQPVTLGSADGLVLTPKDGLVPMPSDESFTFSLSGNTHILWVVDSVKIAGSVAGKSRQAASTILAGFPEVGAGRLFLKPFWAGTMPEDPAEIKIVLEEPESR